MKSAINGYRRLLFVLCLTTKCAINRISYIILCIYYECAITDRNNRPGGGVVIYVRDTFSCIRRTDLEIRGLEAVWVEILIESKKVLVGGFYRPPNTDAHYFNHIIESIDRAHTCNTNISDIIILGDFNSNMLSDNYNKMKELIKTYDMKQLIAEPTYFLIDLIIIRNNNNILTSGVADTFIQDQIRHHCPTVVLLKFLRPHCKTFKRKIWNYKLADYTKYRSLVTDSNLDHN